VVGGRRGSPEEEHRDMRRRLFEAEHEAFRGSVRTFLTKEVTPHMEAWDAEGIVPRQLFTTAGAAGFLGMAIPVEFGGGGVADFRFNAVLGEEIMRAGVAGAGLGLSLHNDICLPYFTSFASEEQKARWLPGIADGSLITALAMTEPEIGSDLAGLRTTAARDDGGYVVNGSKTFITNGINADLVITAVRTDPRERHAGISIVIVERGMDGFERGRNLSKLGMHAQDTAELFFSDVRVPAENLLGEEGQGFRYMTSNLAQERLSIALTGVGAARGALEWTLEYVKQRNAFGKPIGTFQNTRFALAEMATEVELATAFCDQAVLAHNDGQLSPADAAMAKWWATELQGRVIDRCVQLHGGYGYMLEYPIARAYADARVTRIYGGTTEIMKEIIGRSLGL
jgi:alkylation response protein AidB-like acyl-CoA dehydrogenase